MPIRATGTWSDARAYVSFVCGRQICCIADTLSQNSNTPTPFRLTMARRAVCPRRVSKAITMTSKARLVGGVVSIAASLIGTAAAIKALATPTLAPTTPGATATGSSTAVVGSNNVSVIGNGNNTVSGSVSGFGAGAGNTINVQPGAITNVFPKTDRPSGGSSPALAKALPGQWQVSFSYPTALGSNEVAGRTSLLRNGAYTFQGTQTARATTQGKLVQIEWGVTDVGKWIARDGFLTMESSGLRSVIKSMAIDGVQLDLLRLRQAGMPDPRLEDYLPSGMATDFKLLSLAPAEIHMQATSPTGATFDVVSKRTSAI